MSRIPLIEPENAQPEVRAVYDKLQAGGVGVFNVMKMFCNNRHFLEAMYHLIQGIYGDAKLPARYRELAYLRASQLNSCHY